MTMHKRPSTLRDRIIKEMPAILDLMDIKNRIFDEEDDDDDFRPSIIDCIRQVAALELTSPSQARRALDRVEQNIARLKQSIAKLPLNIRDLIEVRGLDEARSQVTGTTKADRKLLAADLTSSLIFNHGGYIPTLTRDGPYIKLANLMYFTATGEKSELEGYCRKLFANLEREELGIYSDERGPRRSFVIDDDIMRIYQRRAEAMKLWPPLEQVVDAALG